MRTMQRPILLHKIGATALPRGAPRMQRRGDTEYRYLQYREGGQVIHKYIGPKASPKAHNVLEEISRRRRYEKLLKETRSALKEVRKALRGKI